jgi:hypothetical protein
MYDVDAVFVNGEKDNNSATSLNAAQQNLILARKTGYARGAIVPAWAETHLNFTWNPNSSHTAADFIYLYLHDLWRIRKALGGKLDASGYIKYPKAPVETGWLGEGQDYSGQHGKPAKAIKTELEIAPYNDFKGDKLLSSWLPSERTARAYRAMTKKQATPIVIEGLKKDIAYLPTEDVTFNVVGTFKNVEIIIGLNGSICKQLPCTFKPNQIGGGVIPIVVNADGAEAFRSIVVRNNGDELPLLPSQELEIDTIIKGSGLYQIRSNSLVLTGKELTLFNQKVILIEYIADGKVIVTRDRTRWGWQTWQLSVSRKAKTNYGMRVHTESKVYETIKEFK